MLGRLKRRFRDLAIRHKIALVSVLGSVTALVLAMGALVGYELYAFRWTLVTRLATQAEIVGMNTASALIFNDPDAATSTLSALERSPRIVEAAVRDEQGKLFARFKRPSPADEGEAELAAGPVYGHRFHPDRLVVYRPIEIDGERLGSVYVASDLSELRGRMRSYATIVGLVMLACLVAIVPVSYRLQRVISDPIRSLARIARRISREKDYAVRALPAGRDEVGVLIETFNTMVAQIQERDAALEDARQSLEIRVQERTQELRQEVSERRRAEQEVRRLNEELEHRVLQRTAQLHAANKELEAFSYSVSHDLRAPLRAINGYSQALREDCADQLDEQGQHYLSRVEAATRRMERLIDDLLGLARVTRSQMRDEPVNLSNLAHEISEDLRETYPDRDAEIRIANGAEVRGDPTLLRMVMENLLGNAWKYSGRKKRAEIEFGIDNASNGEQVYYVRDNGAGFDMAHAAKLFGTFQRLHSNDEFEGTGIGLATVQRAVQRHGGRIWAEAEVDRGATFYFTLAPTVGDS